MAAMRVYIVPETFLPFIGGSERQAFWHSRYLRAQGIEATILTMHFQGASPAYEFIEGVPVIRVAGRLLAWHEHLSGFLRRFCYVLALMVLGWRLWKSRQAYDLLHVFQLSFFTLPVLVVSRLAGKPLIVSMRCDAPPLRAEARGDARQELDGLTRLGRPLLRCLIAQLCYTRARIVVLSARMRESLLHYGACASAIHIIPNGVDTHTFAPHAGIEEQPLTVVCVAKMRYQKGIDILLRAWRLVLDELPEARLVVVGDGPLCTSLRTLADELDISRGVEFTGLCSNVVEQYQRGLVTVLPSRWEGMPNALLEAMACGRACVATRVSGSEELLRDGAHGLLVEPEDQEGLACALWLLLTEPHLARRYGRAARRYIEQHYTFERGMHSYIVLYQKLLRASNCEAYGELSLVGTD